MPGGSESTERFWSFWVLVRTVRRRRPRAVRPGTGRSTIGRSIALQIPGGLRGDLGDIEGDVLLLAAAFDGPGHVVRCLDRVEDSLTMLWIVQHRTVDCRDQVPGFQT